jgi:hypothetical protein
MLTLLLAALLIAYTLVALALALLGIWDDPWANSPDKLLRKAIEDLRGQ